MIAVEFQTKVKDGTIEIPPEYRDDFKDNVRVILLAEQPRVEVRTLIDELLENPVKVANFRPFSRDEIYAR